MDDVIFVDFNNSHSMSIRSYLASNGRRDNYFQIFVISSSIPRNGNLIFSNKRLLSSSGQDPVQVMYSSSQTQLHLQVKRLFFEVLLPTLPTSPPPERCIKESSERLLGLITNKYANLKLPPKSNARSHLPSFICSLRSASSSQNISALLILCSISPILTLKISILLFTCDNAHRKSFSHPLQ